MTKWGVGDVLEKGHGLLRREWTCRREEVKEEEEEGGEKGVEELIGRMGKVELGMVPRVVRKKMNEERKRGMDEC